MHSSVQGLIIAVQNVLQLWTLGPINLKRLQHAQKRRGLHAGTGVQKGMTNLGAADMDLNTMMRGHMRTWSKAATKSVFGTNSSTAI